MGTAASQRIAEVQSLAHTYHLVAQEREAKSLL
jgi:hypothetical protein